MLLTFYYSVAVYTVLIFLFIPNKSAKYNACNFNPNNQAQRPFYKPNHQELCNPFRLNGNRPHCF